MEESKAWMAGLFQTPESPSSENYAVHVIGSQSGPTSSDPEGGIQADNAHGDGAMIGVVGTLTSTIAAGSTARPVATLGYIFHPSSWGKGLATEAIMVFMERFWTLQPAVQAVRAEVDSRNLASIRVLQKCGFEEIEMIRGGGRRLPLIDTDGAQGDLLVFGIQKPGNT